ncbi:MAG: hypothetical protein WBW01_00930, partial [Terriglobales bacterium]
NHFSSAVFLVTTSADGLAFAVVFRIRTGPANAAPKQIAENSGFDFALKGCGFSRTVTDAESMRL